MSAGWTRHFDEEVCAKKTAQDNVYETELAARASLARVHGRVILKRRAKYIHAYKCPVCAKWHLGGQRDKKREEPRVKNRQRCRLDRVVLTRL